MGLLEYGERTSVWILERFQSKAVRMITDASWYVPNTVIRKDLENPNS
jgi:hypothetical protein